MEKTNPSKWKYIGAWILMAVLSRLLFGLADIALASALLSSAITLNAYFIASAASIIPIWVGSFIFVYNLFSSLNIYKVMTYLYVLGTLGVMANLGQVKGELRDTGIDITLLTVCTLLATAISFYLIRSYYIKKPARWVSDEAVEASRPYGVNEISRSDSRVKDPSTLIEESAPDPIAQKIAALQGEINRLKDEVKKPGSEPSPKKEITADPSSTVATSSLIKKGWCVVGKNVSHTDSRSCELKGGRLFETYSEASKHTN